MGRAEDLFQRLEAEGETYIDELIESRKSEESFLDFKRSSNNGSTPKLDMGDRNNLARALSGFANSEGGVIVWGVDCSRDPEMGDVAKAKIPLDNPHRFTSLLEGVLSGCTVPAVQGCRSIAIPSQVGGYVATLIPRSGNAPHQMTQDNRYLIRAGSNFAPVPHAVLAGMFGRHPQPIVFPNFTLGPLLIIGDELFIRGGVTLVNNGSVVAEDCFVSTLATEVGGANTKFLFDTCNSEVFQRTSSLGVDFALMSNREFRLPPGGFTNTFNFSWSITGPLSTGLNIKLIAGCSGAPPYEKKLVVRKDDLIDLVQYAKERWQDPKSQAQVDWHIVAAKMIGLSAHWDVSNN
jgi:hypothetical protein